MSARTAAELSPLITVDAAAARLGVSPQLVYDSVKAGAWWFLGAYAIRGSGEKWIYIIPRVAFERWLAGELVIGKPAERDRIPSPHASPFIRRRGAA